MGRDTDAWAAREAMLSFNSRAPHGARRSMLGATKKPDSFNSRAPHGARRRATSFPPSWPLFQFTRPAWGATSVAADGFRAGRVSIHAPRMGRDEVQA